jgi:carbonic anhydrase/acetyltransferase-like protein (isoleucine patch superfamily)
MTEYALDDRRPRLPKNRDYWIAPTASVIGDVVLKSGSSVWFGAVLRGDNEPLPLVIGENSNVQDNSVLHTDPGLPLIVGANVTIGHMVMVHGATIGDGSLIGIGAILLNGSVIGKGCIVGAGALVTEGKVFPDGSLILGTPARVVREVTDQERQMLAGSALHYVENWKRYAAGLKPRP